MREERPWAAVARPAEALVDDPEDSRFGSDHGKRHAAATESQTHESRRERYRPAAGQVGGQDGIELAGGVEGIGDEVIARPSGQHHARLKHAAIHESDSGGRRRGG